MLILGGICHFVVFLFFSFGWSYFLAKHIYIFRNSYFDEDFNEETVVFWIRFFNVFFSFFLLLLEFILAENLLQLTFLQVLSQGFFDENVNPGIVYLCFSSVVAFTMIGMIKRKIPHKILI